MKTITKNVKLAISKVNANKYFVCLFGFLHYPFPSFCMRPQYLHYFHFNIIFSLKNNFHKKERRVGMVLLLPIKFVPTSTTNKKKTIMQVVTMKRFVTIHFIFLLFISFFNFILILNRSFTSDIVFSN